MLVATLEQERKKIYQTGFVAGKVEGKAEGEVRGQKQALLMISELRFQLTPMERTQLAAQIEKITDLQTLTILIKQALQVATLAEFVKRLIEAQPKDSASQKP